MSDNNNSAIGRVQLRAITGAEVKEIAIHEITKRIRENPLIKRFLTFHNFKMQWGFRISSLADTPVPPEIEGFVNASAPDISDEEIEAIRSNVEKLREKRASLQPFLDRVAILDKYLTEAEIVVQEKGEVSDERKPDVLRQRVGLPIMVTQQVGPRLAEVPLETNKSVEEPKTEFVTGLTANYSPAKNLAQSYSADGGGTPKTEMEQEGVNLDI